MAHKWLGIYVHMHWGYKHPYAARTWTLDDWRAYLGGLTALGYNLLQIWPMVDTMPLPLTASDQAHLTKIGRVIDLAHDEFDMPVWIVLSANAVGNDQAGAFPFESRPYFTCERLMNPGDLAERRELMEKRRVFLEPLRMADGFSIIDGDPGGYPGSTVDKFIRLLADHRALFDAMRPGILLNYWMWWSWRSDMDHPVREMGPLANVLRETVSGMAALNPEPWGLLACNRGHLGVVRSLGMKSRTLYYPYGAIESEPSVPMTNNRPDQIQAVFQGIPPESHPLGSMGNCQTHCFQLPHTYHFAQFARGRERSAINLGKFAEELIPGHGATVAEAWEALAAMDGERIASARQGLAGMHRPEPGAGRLGGLLFDDPGRFLDDLSIQLAWKEAVTDVGDALQSGGDPAPLARALHAALTSLVERTGFRDFYGGPFAQIMHPLLDRLASELPNGLPIRAALDEYAELRGRHVPARHGYLARLVDALAASLG